MRIFSILSALLVALFLYGFVMERDTLRALLGAGAAAETAVEEVKTVAGPTDTAVAVVARRSTATEVESGVILRGLTEANRRVEVRAETSGRVVSEPLRRGAVVSKNEVLCEIEPGLRPVRLAEAEARLLEARANQEASERLAERGFAAETTAIGNRATLQAAQAEVENARLEIERLKITAPFDGLLETDTAEVGALLQPGGECATLIDLDPITLVGFVPESRVERIKVGATAAARLLTGEQLVGEVSFVSRSADPETRTFRVEARASNEDWEIRDGITTEIVISLEGAAAHLLPQSALTLDNSGRLGVRTVVDGLAAFAPVEIVRDSAEGVWLSGLDETVDVIVIGQDFVTDGQPVTVTLQEDPA